MKKDKIVKKKMEELKLTLKDFEAFVPFDEWNLQLLKQSRMKKNEVYFTD